MKKINIVNYAITTKLEDGRDVAIANLKDEFRRGGIDKDEAVLDILYEELIDPKRIGIYELAYELEELADALFTALIQLKAFNESDAKNLWNAIQRDMNGNFDEFYTLLKSLLKKEN